MKKSSLAQWLRFLGGLLAVWVLVELVFYITPRMAHRDPGPLAESVYVWQRVWSPEVEWDFDPWKLTGSKKPERWGWW